MNTPLMRIDESSFPDQIKRWAAATGKNISEAAKSQWRLYHAELIKRTPPFSGKMITRMLIARGKAPLSDPEIEKASAQKVGQNAVARDMRKLFIAVKNWFAVKKGTNWIYLYSFGPNHVGVPSANFQDPPTYSWMQQIRGRYRDKRGRVKYKGTQRESGNGNVTIMKYPVRQEQFDAMTEKLQGKVGQARGGWAAGFAACGGSIGGGWVGKWKGVTGSASADFSRPWNAECLTVNHSDWAQGGDDERIREQSMRARQQSLEKNIEFVLKEKWG